MYVFAVAVVGTPVVVRSFLWSKLLGVRLLLANFREIRCTFRRAAFGKRRAGLSELVQPVNTTPIGQAVGRVHPGLAKLIVVTGCVGLAVASIQFTEVHQRIVRHL